MTQLFLKNQTFTVENGTADSYGATGTKETLVVAAGAVISADQNIERIELSGTSSAYTYSVAGNVVTIKLGTVAVATYTVANGDKTIAFADGSATLVFTKLDAVTLGGQAISATTSSALTGITLNKTDVSASIPTIALTGATTVNEGSAITYTATLSSAAATAVTIPYTLSGTNVTTTDFTGQAALTGNITVAAGATTGTLTLNVAADTTTEGVENLTVTLGAPASGATLGSVSSVLTAISDTSISVPTIGLTQSAATVNEGGTVTYTATLSSAATSALTIPYTLSGTGITPADFGLTALTGNISVAAGATTGTLTLNVAADATTEGVESLTVALATPTSGATLGSASSVVTSIADTPISVPTIGLTGATTVNEGSAITYTATLSSAAATAVTIPYTLSGTGITAADFGLAALTGNISVAAGATTGTLILNVAADTTTEGAENLSVALSAPAAGATLSGTSTVVTSIADTSVTAVAGPNAVTVNVAGTFAATGADDTFSIAAGTYSATITNFDQAGADVLKFFTGASISIVPDTNQTDGIQAFTAQDSVSGTTTTITLTGLTSAQDLGVFNATNSFISTFGAGSIA
jgi:hypothetical protein